ncbi:hypothetical protein ALC56_08944, partial [Trachymyrmex septentrionalis]
TPSWAHANFLISDREWDVQWFPGHVNEWTSSDSMVGNAFKWRKTTLINRYAPLNIRRLSPVELNRPSRTRWWLPLDRSFFMRHQRHGITRLATNSLPPILSLPALFFFLRPR